MRLLRKKNSRIVVAFLNTLSFDTNKHLFSKYYSLKTYEKENIF